MKQLLTKYQIFTILPQISHFHKNCNFSSIFVTLRPTTSSPKISWQGHVRNTLFHFGQLAHWSINGLGLPSLPATMCLYKTRVTTRVVHSYTVDDKVTSPKTWTDSILYNWKFNLFLTFLWRGHQPKYFPKVCS